MALNGFLFFKKLVLLCLILIHSYTFIETLLLLNRVAISCYIHSHHIYARGYFATKFMFPGMLVLAEPFMKKKYQNGSLYF